MTPEPEATFEHTTWTRECLAIISTLGPLNRIGGRTATMSGVVQLVEMIILVKAQDW